jgi:large conductance mechanosensitive channel
LQRIRAGLDKKEEIMMSIIKDFREFAVRGNVVDMAVGIIIGAAFGKVVSSLVSDVFMPPLGWIIGGVDFSDLAIVLPEIIEGKGSVSIMYGQFIQTILDFTIVAFAIFMMIKVINRLKKKEEEKPAEAPVPTKEELLLTEIRDLLKQQQQK